MSSKLPSLKMQWATTGQQLEMSWTSLLECQGSAPQWLTADHSDTAAGPRKRGVGRRHRSLFGGMVALAVSALTAPALGDVFNFDGQATDVASIVVNRNALYSGGQAGFVDSGLRVNDVVGTSASAFEWSILGRVESASPASQAVGVYGQGAATAPGVQVWGGVSEARDATGPGGSPAAATTLVGHEVDIVGGGRSIGIGILTIQGRPTICIYADGNCRLL